MGTDLHRLGCSLVILSTILLYLARILARAGVRACGCAGVRDACSAARSLARALVLLARHIIYFISLGYSLACVARSCGRAGVRVACSAARSLARALVRSLVAVG